MKTPLVLLIIIAVTLPFVSCTPDTRNGRPTVFHPAENSPRSGPSGRPRYGDGGTHSPRERSDSRRDRRARRNVDPDGIVKPRDLDPEPEVSETEVVSTDDHGGTSTFPETVEPEQPDPTPTTGGTPPYAEAVPGKYGLVYSPFKKGALVNVTDDNNVPLPPGTEVTDPHTGKVFRVP